MRYQLVGPYGRRKKDVLARIRMVARLKLYLGDQKIDVIGDHEDSLVIYEDLRKGMRLV